MIAVSYTAMFIVITIAWIIYRAIACLKEKKFSVTNELKMLLAYVCLVVVARVIYFPLHHVNGSIAPMVFDSSKVFPIWYNVVPIVHLFDIYDGWQINIIGNITLFIPVGIVWPICFRKIDTLGKDVLAGLLFTVLIELSQLPLYDRCSDIDDITLNTLGFTIGALIVFGVKKAIKK